MPYKKLALTESNTIDTEASVKYVNHTTESSSLHNSHKNTIAKSKLPSIIPKRKCFTYKEKKKKLFNKIYGISIDYENSLDSIKKERNLSLLEHQNKLLQLSTNLRKPNLIKLNKQLRNIRMESSQVTPLPPLNFRNLVEHSHNEIQKERSRNKLSIQKNLKLDSIKDAYEIEMEKAKIKHYKPTKENSNIARMYEILPEHIVEVFVKRKHNTHL